MFVSVCASVCLYACSRTKPQSVTSGLMKAYAWMQWAVRTPGVALVWSNQNEKVKVNFRAWKEL